MTDPRSIRRRPAPGAAAAATLSVLLLFALGSAPLRARLGERGLALAEWIFLLTPTVLFLAVGRYHPGRSLGLRRPSVRALTGGLLLAAGAAPLAWWVGWVQTWVWPVPAETAQALQELVTARDPLRLAWLLWAVALTPAVCEEAVFRGLLLQATRPLGMARAVTLNALAFGAMHLAPGTAVRFLPTALLGAVLAWAVWTSGSLWVGVAMHALNNAAIVLLASSGSLTGGVPDPSAPPPGWTLPAAVLFTAAGVGIVRASVGTARRTDPSRSSDDDADA